MERDVDGSVEETLPHSLSVPVLGVHMMYNTVLPVRYCDGTYSRVTVPVPYGYDYREVWEVPTIQSHVSCFWIKIKHMYLSCLSIRFLSLHGESFL